MIFHSLNTTLERGEFQTIDKYMVYVVLYI